MDFPSPARIPLCSLLSPVVKHEDPREGEISDQGARQVRMMRSAKVGGEDEVTR